MCKEMDKKIRRDRQFNNCVTLSFFKDWLRNHKSEFLNQLTVRNTKLSPVYMHKIYPCIFTHRGKYLPLVQQYSRGQTVYMHIGYGG